MLIAEAMNKYPATVTKETSIISWSVSLRKAIYFIKKYALMPLIM